MAHGMQCAVPAGTAAVAPGDGRVPIRGGKGLGQECLQALQDALGELARLAYMYNVPAEQFQFSADEGVTWIPLKGAKELGDIGDIVRKVRAEVAAQLREGRNAGCLTA